MGTHSPEMALQAASSMTASQTYASQRSSWEDTETHKGDEKFDASRTNSATSTSSSSSVEFPSAGHHSSFSEKQQPSAAALDWDGPDDPGNPHNWPRWKRIYHTIIPAAIAFTCANASSIIVPGRESLMRDFRVSSEVALLPYIFFVLGLALGPMIAAPCSETFGRRVTYLSSMPVFALFTLGAGFSPTIAGVIICRFLAGLAGSPGLAIGSATIADLWHPADRAVPMALYVMTPFIGPAIGPLLGGFTASAKGWRWTLWTLLFLTAVSLAPTIFMSETYKKTILQRRLKMKHKKVRAAGDAASESDSKRELPALPRKNFADSAQSFFSTTLTRPLHMAVVEPVVAFFTIYVSLNIGMLYGFFAAFPYVFRTKYGFNLDQIGLTFLGLGVGALSGAAVLVIWSKFFYAKQVHRVIKFGSTVAPEARLGIAMIGSVMIPASLFLFGWTAEYSVHWIVPVIAEAFFGCGNFLVFMACVMYLMDFYGPRYGASAMAANNLLRYLIGAAFPLFAVQMYKGLGVGWATSLLGFVQLALTPIPWFFYHYGPRLRERTRYAK